MQLFILSFFFLVATFNLESSGMVNFRVGKSGYVAHLQGNAGGIPWGTSFGDLIDGNLQFDDTHWYKQLSPSYLNTRYPSDTLPWNDVTYANRIVANSPHGLYIAYTKQQSWVATATPGENAMVDSPLQNCVRSATATDKSAFSCSGVAPQDGGPIPAAPRGICPAGTAATNNAFLTLTDFRTQLVTSKTGATHVGSPAIDPNAKICSCSSAGYNGGLGCQYGLKLATGQDVIDTDALIAGGLNANQIIILGSICSGRLTIDPTALATLRTQTSTFMNADLTCVCKDSLITTANGDGFEPYGGDRCQIVPTQVALIVGAAPFSSFTTPPAAKWPAIAGLWASPPITKTFVDIATKNETIFPPSWVNSSKVVFPNTATTAPQVGGYGLAYGSFPQGTSEMFSATNGADKFLANTFFARTCTIWDKATGKLKGNPPDPSTVNHCAEHRGECTSKSWVSSLKVPVDSLGARVLDIPMCKCTRETVQVSVGLAGEVQEQEIPNSGGFGCAYGCIYSGRYETKTYEDPTLGEVLLEITAQNKSCSGPERGRCKIQPPKITDVKDAAGVVNWDQTTNITCECKNTTVKDPKNPGNFIKFIGDACNSPKEFTAGSGYIFSIVLLAAVSAMVIVL